MRKKILLLASLFILLCVSLFAEDTQMDNWWVGKSITDFRYENLQNVSQNDVNSLLKKYKNQEFTDAVSAEIDSILYSQEWMDYYMMSAETAADGTSLVLALEIHEVPMIANISFEGNEALKKNTLIENQSLSVGDFYSPGLLRAAALSLQDYYVSRGYRDAKVEISSFIDEEKNSVNITYTIVEGPQYKISSIEFIGVNSVPVKELTKQMDSKERSFFKSGNFVQSTLDTDLTKILSYYNDNGYIDAKILSCDIEDVTTSEDKYSMLAVTITIDEGAQWLLGNITFSGNEVFTDEQIQDAIYLKSGIINNATEILTQIQSIASIYYNEGYIQTQIIPNQTKNEDTHTIDYHLTINESIQSVIEKIVITGLTKTKPHVIERELELQVGDVFSQEKLQKSGQNIMNTSIVTNIATGLYQGEQPNGVVLELAVEEGNQMELQFGATFGGTVDGFPVSGFLQWSDKNLFGTGRDFSISTTISPDTQSASISLSDDWVGNQRWANGLSFSFERSEKSGVLQKGIDSDYYDGRDREHVTYPLGYDSALGWYGSGQVMPASSNLMSYDFYRIALAYNTGYTWVWNPGSLSITGGISIGLNHAIYDSIYTPYDLLIKKYHDGWQFSNKLSLGISWDGRDLKENTTSGYLFSLGYTYAGGFLGGLSNFNKLSLSGAGYVSLFGFENEKGQSRNLVLSATSSVSFMLPQYWNNKDKNGWDTYMANQGGATKYEMLYLDGMNIGRGFNTVFDQSFLWHNQLELSFPLVLNVLNAEAYISASGAAQDLEDLASISNLHWYFSAGAGIKLKVPGFPLGLYLVKTAELDKADGFRFNNGPIFNELKLVLAITTSIY